MLTKRSVSSFIVTAAFLFVLSAGSAFGQTDKENAVKAARAHETAPFAKETAAMREKALKWVIETDEVHLTVCGGIFSMFSDKKNKNATEITTAYTLGMAAFVIENADKANDEDAIQLAGLESALKTYEAIVKEKPKTKNDKIDALIAKRDSGQLAADVKAADCGKK